MSGPGVQVGAYSNRESAEKGWTRLSQQYEALSGVRYRIVEGRADIGTVYRLQAVPGDASAANRLCATLKGAGLSCQVKR
jgi:cell division protein FtsN